MSTSRQFTLIGVAVVVSGLAAVVTADKVINGAIGTMDEKTSQTSSTELQNTIQTPDGEQTQTVTVPEGVLQAKATQQPSNEAETLPKTDNAVTEPSAETPQPQRPTFIQRQPTSSVPTEIQSTN